MSGMVNLSQGPGVLLSLVDSLSLLEGKEQPEVELSNVNSACKSPSPHPLKTTQIELPVINSHFGRMEEQMPTPERKGLILISVICSERIL